MIKSPTIIDVDDLPILYGPDERMDRGDSISHFLTVHYLYFGIQCHFAKTPEYAVLGDMSLDFHEEDPLPDMSPDVMVVRPYEPLPQRVISYRIGATGPQPCFVAEVLSRFSDQQGDKRLKPVWYSSLGIREYLMIDVTAEFLPGRLSLRRLDEDHSWVAHRDEDGGITSELGFRVTIDMEDHVRTINSLTGIPYPRPEETTLMALRLQQQVINLQRQFNALRGLTS